MQGQSKNAAAYVAAASAAIAAADAFKASVVEKAAATSAAAAADAYQIKRISKEDLPADAHSFRYPHSVAFL